MVASYLSHFGQALLPGLVVLKWEQDSFKNVIVFWSNMWGIRIIVLYIFIVLIAEKPWWGKNSDCEDGLSTKVRKRNI